MKPRYVVVRQDVFVNGIMKNVVAGQAITDQMVAIEYAAMEIVKIAYNIDYK